MELKDLLSEVVAGKASDLHLTAGNLPFLRKDGQLSAIEAVNGETLVPLAPDDVLRLFEPYVAEGRLAGVRQGVDINTSIEWSKWRFRCCIFRDRAGNSAALRLIPDQIPTLSALFGDPYGDSLEIFQALCRHKRGLILLVGPVGSGKSTTVAAMIDEINCERAERIITIEDPIEYSHSNKKSVFSQREVGIDVESLEQGALSALRADLDVALISELRTPEAVRIALSLAESGHLVFSTVHANTVSEAVQRIVESFPDSPGTIRSLLARAMTAVVAQVLIPLGTPVPGVRLRVPANEILLGSARVREMIDSGAPDLTVAIEAGRESGMRTMDDSVVGHFKAGRISYETAWSRVGDRGRLGPRPETVVE